MAFSSQPNFNGVLDGTDVNELNKKIDYSKIHLEERKEVIEKLINGTAFYEDYFSDFFKANINAGDHLSTDVNVCQSLERMANYLLNSKEIKQEEDAEKTKYVFHTDEKYFQKKVNRETSVDHLSKSANPDHQDNVIHFLKRNETNYKKEKVQDINYKSLKPTKTNSQEDIDEVKRILSEYRVFYDSVTEKLLDKDRDVNRYLLTNTKGQLTDDMIYTKDSLLGIFGYNLKNGTKEDAKPSLDIFDFTNESHLKGKVIEVEGRTVRGEYVSNRIMARGLIFFKPTSDYTDDFNLTLLDLQETIKKANLTEEEQIVLSMSQNGSSQFEIATYLNTYDMKISRILDRIVRKIRKVGNKYDLTEVS